MIIYRVRVLEYRDNIDIPVEEYFFLFRKSAVAKLESFRTADCRDEADGFSNGKYETFLLDAIEVQP